MARRDLVCVGASAGGVEALGALVARLPLDLPAAVLIVLHMHPKSASNLPAILTRAGRTIVRYARDGDVLAPGTILVGPPDHHLAVRGDVVALTRGPRENHCRPSVDVLFRTAARWRGARVVGVVLSGTLSDGAAGSLAVARAGGQVLIQDPSEAAFPGMPQAALEAVPSARVVSIGDIAGDILRALGVEGASEGVMQEQDPGDELKQAQQENVHRQETDGPSAYSCPDCGGALLDLGIGEPIRLGCRTGHVFTLEALAGTQVELVEGALSVALRAVREHEAVVRRLARRASSTGNTLSAERFDDEAGALRKNGDIIEALIAGRFERSVPGDERAEPVGGP